MNDIIVSTESLDLNDTIEDKDDERTCGICTEEFNRDEEDYIKLDCVHEYHYSCINEYFSTISSLKGLSSTNNRRECPYCRKISSLLPIKMGITPISGVHRIIKTVSKSSSSRKRCLATCKNGKKCKNYGKSEYSGYCGTHKNLMNS